MVQWSLHFLVLDKWTNTLVRFRKIDGCHVVAEFLGKLTQQLQFSIDKSSAHSYPASGRAIPLSEVWIMKIGVCKCFFKCFGCRIITEVRIFGRCRLTKYLSCFVCKEGLVVICNHDGCSVYELVDINLWQHIYCTIHHKNTKLADIALCC